jgi:hypothetical protein
MLEVLVRKFEGLPAEAAGKSRNNIDHKSGPEIP